MNVTRLLIVDDDPLVRSALTFMLGGQPDLEVVGEAGDGREGVTRAAELKPDVVLMDIRMPRLNGLDATRRLLASDDPPRVIVLTTFDADEYVVEALAAGADGFLLKDTPPPEVVDAIRKVAQGDPMLSPAVTRSLIRRVATSNRLPAAVARLAELTDREREVALAVAVGSATPTSRPSSTSPCRPSRRTCRGCSTSSASPTASRSRCACTTRG